MSIPRILFIGKIHREEFRLVYENLPEVYRRNAAVTEEIPREMAEEPDVILLLQSFPGEYSPEEAAFLRERFPVTPILAILGSWCDGEERSGTPLAGIPRMPWTAWIMSAPRELEMFSHGKLSLFSLPATLSAEDGFSWRAEMERKRGESFFSQEMAAFCRNKEEPRRVFIYSAEMEQAETLREIFAQDSVLRHVTSCMIFTDFNARSVTAPDFVLADFSDFRSETKLAFSALRKRYPDAACFAFCEFPRAEQWRWLEELGVKGIFAKPFHLPDFVYQFSRAFQ